MKITRDVVSDLWPVYEAGEASADTRAVVEAFLAGDPAFADTLRGRDRIVLPPMEGTVALDQEALALKRTRDLVQGRAWLRGLRLFALVMSVMAAARFIEDTTFTAPPSPAVATAAVALTAWAVYCVILAQQRRKALRG